MSLDKAAEVRYPWWISAHDPAPRGGASAVVAAALLSAVLLGGCDSAPTAIPVDDPAMASAAAKDAAPAAEPGVEPRPAPADPEVPTRRDGRVFIPELGWLDESAFWQTYASAPEKLPGTLDLYAVHQLRLEYERERESAGES